MVVIAAAAVGVGVGVGVGVVLVSTAGLLRAHVWHRSGSRGGGQSWRLVERGSGLGLGHVPYARAVVRLTRRCRLLLTAEC